ncbi:MAG: hypothetical protein KF865_01690 [Bdellovibrionaceae bacterium]|nr:hypothetical protein [Pseudobdellovibrionaceae bacterium]
MNAINGIFVALALVFGGGYALDKIYAAVKGAAVERVNRGTPSLSSFTNRLTCSKISKEGDLQKISCKRRK